jgi:triosephosphate isomerase
MTTVADRLEGSNIKIAAQDCSTEVEEGAHTGEVTAAMLKDVGAHFVIVGHSERRQFYFETDSMVRKKSLAVISTGMTAIMCVGESMEQRDQGIAENVVRGQLSGGLSGLTASDLDRIIVAYEPVWAIGTGRTATPEQAQEMHAFIRRVFAERYSDDAGLALRILYGGSVKPENISALMAQADIDGALVGGASLKSDSFAKIVNYR